MRKLFIFLSVALMLGLICTSAIADTPSFPITAESFPTTADAISIGAPYKLDFDDMSTDQELIIGLILLDDDASYMGDFHFGANLAIDVDYFDDEGNYSAMSVTKNGYFTFKKTPDNFDLAARNGTIRINVYNEVERTGNTDTYTITRSLSTHEIVSSSAKFAEDGATWEFEFNSEGRLTYYGYSSAEYGKYGSWGLYFDENGAAQLKSNYTVQFADGTLVRYDRFGRYIGNDEVDIANYPAPLAMEPNMNVYAMLTDTGIDLNSMLIGILTLNDLGVTVDGSVIDIPKTGATTAPSASFKGNQRINGTSKFIDGAYHQLIDCAGYTADDFEYLAISYIDENKRDVRVYYTDIDQYKEVDFDQISSDPFLFTKIAIYYSTNTIVLQYDLVRAEYDLTTGMLTEYRYEAMDGTAIGYDANGNYLSSYGTADPTLYPPLTIIGK